MFVGSCITSLIKANKAFLVPESCLKAVLQVADQDENKTRGV